MEEVEDLSSLSPTLVLPNESLGNSETSDVTVKPCQNSTTSAPTKGEPVPFVRPPPQIRNQVRPPSPSVSKGPSKPPRTAQRPPNPKIGRESCPPVTLEPEVLTPSPTFEPRKFTKIQPPVPSKGQIEIQQLGSNKVLACTNPSKKRKTSRFLPSEPILEEIRSNPIKYVKNLPDFDPGEVDCDLELQTSERLTESPGQDFEDKSPGQDFEDISDPEEISDLPRLVSRRISTHLKIRIN